MTSLLKWSILCPRDLEHKIGHFNRLLPQAPHGCVASAVDRKAAECHARGQKACTWLLNIIIIIIIIIIILIIICIIVYDVILRVLLIESQESVYSPTSSLRPLAT